MATRVVGLSIGLSCFALATPALAGPSASTELGTEPRSQSIIGGEATDPGDFDGVVALEIGEFLCTGTVVAPRLILTAGHCLKGMRFSDRIVVHYGNDLRAGAVEADGWAMHPQYCRDCEPSALDIYDYAYVTIPVDFIVPGGYTLPIVDQDEWDEAMRKGSEITLVGYGGDRQDGDRVYGAGVQREVETKIRRFSPEGLEFFAGGDHHDTCSGDSGGPAFVRLASGALRLAGITSRGSDPCGNGGYYGTPYPALCWVRDETGVDLVGESCSACDCIDTSPPEERDGCSIERGSGLGALAVLAVLGFLRRRRR